MTRLDLDSEETAVLRQVMERYLSDLRMEITDTDRKDYREMLKAQRRSLEGILDRLGPSRRGPRRGRPGLRASWRRG